MSNKYLTEIDGNLLGLESGEVLTIKDSNAYNKPSTGIPKSDLSSDVQASLGKADTAIQDISGKSDVGHKHTKSDITDFPTSMPASDVKAWAKADTKPTYTATEVGAIPNTTTHLSGDVALTSVGAKNGVASLDENGYVPSSQLPSYVDDVLEYTSSSDFPKTGESGKIYVDTTTNKTYRWSGTQYVVIGSSLALGETSSTAYAGDKGKATTDIINSHTADGIVHITNTERTTWSGKQDKLTAGTNITISGNVISAAGEPIPENVVYFGSGSGSYSLGSTELYTSDIADNLTTDDASKVLSAKQGKILYNLITSIVDGNEVEY